MKRGDAADEQESEIQGPSPQRVVALLLYGINDMKAAPQKQPYTQDAAKVPGWLRNPESRHADLERPKLDEATRVAPAHEDSGDEEPGYGHGV